MRRTEPYQIIELGYQWDDPRDIVNFFEKRIAEYANAKYAVAVDCASNGLFLCLKYRNAVGRVIIPKHTYVSLPMQIIHAGLTPVFSDEEWSGIYELEPWNIFDSAARFTKDMYIGNDSLQVLSFQIKKRLPIGKGGAILTNSLEAYNWLKLSSYDGRNLETPYDSDNHVSQMGWHFYMTPEDAARGLLLMNLIDQEAPDSMDWRNYPDLSKIELFRKMLS